MEPVLGGILAFVDVWSSNRTENYSKTFEQQLVDMGAKVSKTLNKHVTHVIFKDGRLTTWRKAQKMGVKIVSVLWVEKCRETGVRADESLFPAVDTGEELPLLIKKHRCMQPKDFVEKTPENDRKLQRKLDQMAKKLAVQKTTVDCETDVPVLLFEDSGLLVYSPSNKIKDQSTAMEKRIKEMKEKRENLSPTASQMSRVSPSNSPGGCSPSTCALTNPEDALLPGEQMEDCMNSSYDCLWGTDRLKRQKTEVVKPACDTWTDIHVSMSASVNSPSHIYEQNNLTPKQHFRRSLRKKQILQYDLDDKLPLDKKDLKMLSKDENSGTTSVASESSAFQIKGLDHVSPSKKTGKLNTVPTLTGILSNSPMNSDDFNTYSGNRSFSVDRNDRTREDKQRKKRKALSSWTLATSELDTSGSKESLQADNTCSKSFCAEGDSYEDFFASCNFNENEVQVQVPKASQNPPEISFRDSFTSMDSIDASFCKPHTAPQKRRKKSVSANDVSGKKNFKPPEHPGRLPLNYMTDGEKAEAVEALDFDDANRLPQHAVENFYKTNMNCSTHTTGDENEFSECRVTDGSHEVSNEQKNKHNEGLRKTRRLQKPTRTLVMTSMSPEMQDIVIQVVNKLGDFLFSDDVCEATTHVVAGSPRRTLNVMLGIARGCWIVSYEWVLWSLEMGHWISEEPYELSSSFPAAPICRLQRHLSTGKYQQNLFSNQPVMFVSPTSQPPCKKLIELIQLSGGRICKALHQAKICIGINPGKKYQEIKCLSEKWILDSITQHTICPMENYIFQL